MNYLRGTNNKEEYESVEKESMIMFQRYRYSCKRQAYQNL